MRERITNAAVCNRDQFLHRQLLEPLGRVILRLSYRAALWQTGHAARRHIMITTDSIREIQDRGYCVLSAHLPPDPIDECRDAFWPVLLAHLKAHSHEPNRGPGRHFLP